MFRMIAGRHITLWITVFVTLASCSQDLHRSIVKRTPTGVSTVKAQSSSVQDVEGKTQTASPAASKGKKRGDSGFPFDQDRYGEPGQNPHQSPGSPLTDIRSYDGTDNNPIYANWGAADQTFIRILAPDYDDDQEAPRSAGLPSARAVSNAVVTSDGSDLDIKGASDFLWQWGQFIDHDVTLTKPSDPKEPHNIDVPTGDKWFDPNAEGDQEIALSRSNYRIVDGVRQQVNSITAYLDGSQVYGSDEDRTKALRTLDGTGKLKTSEGGFLPFNTDGLANDPSADAPNFYLAGDVRANEQTGLTVMHTLFVREHNHLATKIKADYPGLDGEQVFQLARAIVAGEIQVITFKEFLPVLLGEGAIAPYSGYKPNVDASITNVFATAAYRFGHSAISPKLLRLDANGSSMPQGPLELKNAFFRPASLQESGGLEPILRGMASQRQQRIDTKVVDALRNFLFGAPGSGGFDLAALNIQRGREHGLPSYNQARRTLGLTPAASFADITSDPDLAAALASVYDSAEDVDIWVGGLAEDPYGDALVGELFFYIIKDQFERIRDGDRYWYSRYLPHHWVDWVRSQTLAKIIRRNTEIGREIQDRVFLTD